MKRGGKRKGSGRKKKYGEPTKTVAFRIPLSKEEDIRGCVKSHLETAIK